MPPFKFLTVLAVYVLVLVDGVVSQSTCVPQGMLHLDKPYQPPKRSIVDLPLCEKYQSCSCCNASHVLTIRKSLEVSVFENPDLLEDCKQSLKEIPCRVCDPEVGVGLKEKVCQSKCEHWFSSCRDHFFSYIQSTGRLSACRTDDNSPLICTQLNDLVSDGEEFCEAMGVKVAASSVEEDCWDGSVIESYGLCEIVPPRPALWWIEHIAWIPSLFALLFLFWLTPRLFS
ncbi:hypothetical protein BSKO_09608 [Bryopsis sp. KO-2023]|nr:hypothetical protein BSKO_09608 [Bryopsis sp. KO-2023]